MKSIWPSHQRWPCAISSIRPHPPMMKWLKNHWHGNIKIQSGRGELHLCNVAIETILIFPLLSSTDHLSCLNHYSFSFAAVADLFIIFPWFHLLMIYPRFLPVMITFVFSNSWFILRFLRVMIYPYHLLQRQLRPRSEIQMQKANPLPELCAVPILVLVMMILIALVSEMLK